MAATANQRLYEATLKHQVDLLRFSEGQAKEAVAVLDAAEAELIEKVAAALASGKGVDRLESQLSSIQARRKQVYEALNGQMQESLTALAQSEYTLEEGTLHAVSPVQLNLARVPLEQLNAVVTSPIAGIPLKGWLDNIAETEALGLQRLVTQGVLQGETIDQIVTRIRGTKAGDYKDGLMAVSRRNAEALAITAVNHVSNAARSKVWEANSDIIRAKRWTSTLDGRTSSICQGRDGLLVPMPGRELEAGERALVPEGAVPPAHFRCRSVLVAILDGVELAGDRPSVMDTRTRAKREADFRAEAKRRGVPIQQVRKEWAEKNVGQVPAGTSYDAWLRKQPVEFQNEVLGAERAEQFRKGLTLDKFVDASGKKLTLDELKAASKRHVMEVVQPGVGQAATALLQQGLTDEAVLTAVLNQFPDAKTTLNSIKSYKSSLNKAGLMPAQTVKSAQTVASVSQALKDFEDKLPSGLKSAVGGQWANVVEEIQGLPGTYAHYSAGKGVVVSASKLKALTPEHAEMVLAHELGHLLAQQHDLLAAPGGGAIVGFAQKKAGMAVMSPEALKLYSYYLSDSKELQAEVIAQALKGSAVTSQGLSASEFNKVFAGSIEEVKAQLALKFPSLQAKPDLVGGPVLPGEVAGKHTSIGSLAKALLQQGLTDDQVLAGVKAQFPNANTGLNSIKSYKSELKKAGLLGNGKTGPTVVVTPPPPPPAPPTVALLPDMKPATTQVPPGQWKSAAFQLFDKGMMGNQDVADALQKLFPFNPTINYSNVASTKVAWKKHVGNVKASQAEKLAEAKVKASPPSTSGSHSKVAKAVEAQATAKEPPSLYGKPLGPYSSKLKAPLMAHAKKGGTFEDALPIFKGVYGPNFDPAKGIELWKFCEWEAMGQPGLADYLKAKAAKEAEDAAKRWMKMQPTRVATSPREGLPPPPRFTEEQRAIGVRRFGKMQTAGFEDANAAQRRLGLPELTPTEYSAVRVYTSNAAFEMNRLLRSNKYAEDLELQAFVDAAQQGLLKMPKHKGQTRRGITLGEADKQKLLSVYVEGGVVEDDAFVSTALPGGGFGGNIEFKVNGKTGVDVARYSFYTSEKEVLFMPGVRFRVDRVTKSNARGQLEIELTEI